MKQQSRCQRGTGMQSVALQAVTVCVVMNDRGASHRRVPFLGRGASGGAAALPGRLDVAAVDRLGHSGGDGAAGGGLRRPFRRHLRLAPGGGAVLPPVEGDAHLALRLLRGQGGVEEQRREGEECRDGEEGGALHDQLRSAPNIGRIVAMAHTRKPAMAAFVVSSFPVTLSPMTTRTVDQRVKSSKRPRMTMSGIPVATGSKKRAGPTWIANWLLRLAGSITAAMTAPATAATIRGT